MFDGFCWCLLDDFVRYKLNQNDILWLCMSLEFNLSWRPQNASAVKTSRLWAKASLWNLGCNEVWWASRTKRFEKMCRSAWISTTQRVFFFIVLLIWESHVKPTVVQVQHWTVCSAAGEKNVQLMCDSIFIIKVFETFNSSWAFQKLPMTWDTKFDGPWMTMVTWVLKDTFQKLRWPGHPVFSGEVLQIASLNRRPRTPVLSLGTGAWWWTLCHVPQEGSFWQGGPCQVLRCGCRHCIWPLA